MIVVDTNVLSATMRVAVEPAVERWLDAQPPEAIWTTTITILEILEVCLPADMGTVPVDPPAPTDPRAGPAAADRL